MARPDRAPDAPPWAPFAKALHERIQALRDPKTTTAQATLIDQIEEAAGQMVVAFSEAERRRPLNRVSGWYRSRQAWLQGVLLTVVALLYGVFQLLDHVGAPPWMTATLLIVIMVLTILPRMADWLLPSPPMP